MHVSFLNFKYLRFTLNCTTPRLIMVSAFSVRNQVFVWIIMGIPFDPDLSVTYSLKWWDMTYSLLATVSIHELKSYSRLEINV